MLSQWFGMYRTASLLVFTHIEVSVGLIETAFRLIFVVTLSNIDKSREVNLEYWKALQKIVPTRKMIQTIIPTRRTAIKNIIYRGIDAGSLNEYQCHSFFPGSCMWEKFKHWFWNVNVKVLLKGINLPS
jgi:hypothetical protein